MSPKPSRGRRPFADDANLAAALIASALAHRAAATRTRFLRELIRHAAAGLAILEGDEAASEACYRVADSAVAGTPAGRRP